VSLQYKKVIAIIYDITWAQTNQFVDYAIDWLKFIHT